MSTPESTVTAPPLRLAAATRALAQRQAQHSTEVTRLIEAAFRLIRRQGVVEPGVREVVAEAGLPNRSFYRHFATKDEFWLVLLEDNLAHLTADVAKAMQAASDPLQQVEAWMLTIFSQATDPEAIAVGRPFLMHGARLRDAHPEVYRATGSALLDLLEQAIHDAAASGLVRSDDARGDARAIFNLCLSVMQSHVLDRTLPSPNEQARVMGFAFRALGVQ